MAASARTKNVKETFLTLSALMRPSWMTLLPPLNGVGVVFASSFPDLWS